MTRVIATLCIAAIVLAGTASLASARTGVVTGSVVNLRAGPGTSHPVTGQVVRGDRLDVLDMRGDWVQVRTSAGHVGWIAGWLLEIDYSSSLTMVVVNGLNVNIRSGPGTSFGVIGQANRPDAFPLAGQQGDWLKVTLPSGNTGWLASWLVRLQVISPDMFSVPSLSIQGTVLSQAPVRRMPSTGVGQFATLNRGAIVPVVTSTGAWHQVRLSNGNLGWVEGRHLRIANVGASHTAVDYTFASNRVEIRQYAQAVVDRQNVNLRTGPSTSYPVVTMLQRGLPLKVIGTHGDWLQVITHEGDQGWVANWLTVTVFQPRLELVTLVSANPQQKTLTVQGRFDTPPSLFWLEDGKTAVVWTNAQSHDAKAAVHQDDILGLTVNAHGVMIRFTDRPEHRIVERSLNKMTISFTSAVTGVELVELPDRDILRFSTLGNAVPSVTYDSVQGLRVMFPNVSYQGPGTLKTGQMARSTTIQPQASGLLVRVDSAARGRYIVRKYPNRVDVELLRPGLAGKVIVLDPGHGGPDPGAVGPAGLHEKVPNLQLALLLKPLLEAEGAIVHLTRTTDSAVVAPADYVPPGFDPLVNATHDLRARAAWAHLTGADVFLSIHNNGHTDRSIAGTTTLYYPGLLNSDASLQLARSIHQGMLDLGRQDRGIRASELSLLYPLTQPAVIAEVVYVTNAGEEALLRDQAFLERAARALLNGLRHYFAP